MRNGDRAVNSTEVLHTLVKARARFLGVSICHAFANTEHKRPLSLDLERCGPCERLRMNSRQEVGVAFHSKTTLTILNTQCI